MNMVANEEGFFVDWEGLTRCVVTPGNCFTCDVVDFHGSKIVQLKNIIDGLICFEADYYPTLDTMLTIGITPVFSI